MKKLVVFLGFITSVFQASAQEMWGAASSNYAGQMGLDLNPASIAGAPYQYELHFLSSDISVANNYMYLRADSRIIRKSMSGEVVDENRFTDRYTRTPDKFAYGSAFLKYPAFIHSGKNWSWGVNISTRGELSARNVPYHLAKFIKEGIDYDPQQQIDYSEKNITAALLNWHELAFTGAKVLVNTSTSFITAGVTVKYNYGLNAAYVRIKDIDYNSVADTLLDIHNVDGEYAHALPDNGHDGFRKSMERKGGGFGLNAGVQYYHNRSDSWYDPCNRNRSGKPYDFKIGASLIDIGYIKFNNRASTYSFNGNSTDWYGIDTVKLDGIGYTDSLLANQFLGNPLATFEDDKFTMFLPMAASVQFDYAVSPLFFVNLSVIQRLPVGPYSIKRSNQISLTPRLETRAFELAVPYSFYDMFRHRLGVAARIGIITVGTDMIGPFVGLTDTYGADIYFAIKWQFNGDCSRAGGKGRKIRSIEECTIGN